MADSYNHGTPPDNKPNDTRTILVIGMGMTAIAFIEKLFECEDQNGTNNWTVIVAGEEPHLAYNRVGLTQYFSHRSIEDLYLQPLSWYKSYPETRFSYITDDRISYLDPTLKRARSSKGREINYDICVFATGSQAALPPWMTASDAETIRGVFSYRDVADLERMIEYSNQRSAKSVAVVGGGLLGLEAAKALADLNGLSNVTIIERNKWILSRQLDQKGGEMVLDHVNSMNIQCFINSRVQSPILAEKDGQIFFEGLLLDDGVKHPFDMVVLATGITPRDEIARESGIEVHKRGGIVIQSDLKTSVDDIYAIGECASWEGKTYGLIAPGIEMANVLAYNLTKGQKQQRKSISTPDTSTKLKLAGVNVASFGDYFGDKNVDGKGNLGDLGPVRPLSYHDPFSAVYKKYLFTADGKYLVGGIMVGDVNDYTKLLSLVKQRKPLDIPPGQLILGVPRKEGEFDGDDLDDSTQICSCYNISKGAIAQAVKDGCKSFGEVKSKTKVSTGCGGCAPLATSIFSSEMKKLGHAVMNHICPHFQRSRQDLFMIVKIRKLTTFDEVMKEAGSNPKSIGCEICKPAVASILSSLHNDFVLKPSHHQNQDTNDKYLANIQRNGTYSVIPRIPAGEITPEKLEVLAVVAQKYSLYTKITGGQRIDLFGAKKQDLPNIWEELGQAGFESGHAYGKALRTVKSCVGTSWCRFGVGDSVGLAVELEERYKGIRGPHKFKGGVSGCVRECAEAQGKDFGVIATSNGWNVYIGGNGGAKPRHAELLAADVSRERAVQIIDRFLMLYIQSADRLQRTARWVESLGENGKNGLEYLKHVILDDSLGICKDLDQSMKALVGTYFDEWAEVVRNPEKRALFRQFVNTDEFKEGSEMISQRGQNRPVDWPQDSEPLKFQNYDIPKTEWQWLKVAKVQDLRPTNLGSTSIVINYSDTQLAVFRLANGQLYATQQMCPHRRAFVLSDGLLGETPDGKPYVSCPLHKRNFALQEGQCLTDDNYSILTFEVKEYNEDILLKLPDPEAIDAVLGTVKWMVKQATKESLKISSVNHIEVVAPQPEVPSSDMMKGAIVQGCVANNKDLNW